MTKDNIDWKGIAYNELWRRYVYDENAMSGYFIVDEDGYEGRNCPKGSVHPFLAAQSWIHPSAYHELTVKELMLYLGIWPLDIDERQ